MNRIRIFLLALVVCLQSPVILAAQPERSELGHDQLMSASHPANGPVDNSYFLPQDGAATAHHRFSGAITIPEHAMHPQPEAILPAEVAGKMTQLFPGLTFHFVSHKSTQFDLERPHNSL